MMVNSQNFLDAEAALQRELAANADLSASQKDAVCFPIRMLIAADGDPRSDAPPDLSSLAREVGETKPTA